MSNKQILKGSSYKSQRKARQEPFAQRLLGLISDPAFIKFIAGDDALYREIIKPIDEEARERDETFRQTYNGKINEMALEFGKDFLTKDAQIDWLKLVDYVSKRADVTNRPAIKAARIRQARRRDGD